jgi:hypothetical protein
MKKYFVLLFICFSGLEPLGFLTNGLIPNTGFDFLLPFFIAILYPLLKGKLSLRSGYLRLSIQLIVAIVLLRFVLDANTVPSYTPGPWKIYLFYGLFYLAYFSLVQNIDEDNFEYVINAFIGVATFCSIISVLQLIAPTLPFYGGLESLDKASDVGSNFVRLRTTFYHNSMLAFVLLVYKLVGDSPRKKRKIVIPLIAMLQFATILIAGYRASLYMLIFTVGSSFIVLYKRFGIAARVLFFLLLIPVGIFMYSYISQRNEETANVNGETSLLWRTIEIGFGAEKMISEGKIVFGIGYNDCFWNPLGEKGSEETYYLHNGYASIVYNYGLVGAAVWLLLIGSILKFLFQEIKFFKSDPFFVFISFFLLGQLAVNYSNGIFNRERNATFCFLFAFALLERYVQLKKKSVLISSSNRPDAGEPTALHAGSSSA